MRFALKILAGVLLAAMVVSAAWQSAAVRYDRAMEKLRDENPL